jgi:hypothetical protein
MIKLLDTSFRGKGETKGFLFTQLDASPSTYLYEVCTGESIHYEVIKRKVDNRFNTETYPKAKSFGKTGFTFHNLEKARLRFKMMSDITQA